MGHQKELSHDVRHILVVRERIIHTMVFLTGAL